MTDDHERKRTIPEALQEWRVAERNAAVARRGRLAAQAAMDAAVTASEAAAKTAEAAKAALRAAELAEESATRTADSARHVVLAADVDLTDARAEAAVAEIEEVHAKARYREAADRA